MKRITEGAFAKLNLTLDVLDRRADGYHDIKSIMQTVSLHDDVLVDLGGEGWQVHCYRELLPPDADENTTPELVTCGLPQDRDNLAWKAAEAFYARTGLPREGLEIFISKRIPMQAGLGGGSAIDTAKAAAIMVNNPGTYWDYAKLGKEIVEKVLPVIAIPTTAGTGTETNQWCMISNRCLLYTSPSPRDA